MISLDSLWMAILVSAILVWIGGYIVWKVLPHHKNEEAANQPMDAKKLGLHFVYCLVVGIFVAYLAGLALPAGSEYMVVFRFTAAAAFSIHGLSVIPDAIWQGRPWSFVYKNFGDSLFYGLLTGGAFGWLWP